MAQPTFLQTIPHEYILMPNIKHAFAPIGVGLKWSLEECEFKKGSNQYISVVYYLKAPIMPWWILIPTIIV